MNEYSIVQLLNGVMTS